jgi:hypothetical protein
VYSTFDNIRRSLEIAWKYKILWVFALLVAGSSLNYSSSSNSGSKEDEQKIQEIIEKYVPDSNSVSSNITGDGIGERVLGAATSTTPFLQEYLSNILIIGTTLLAVMLFAMAIGLIVRSWAFGSFIYGTSEAVKNRELQLRNLSDVGRVRLREVIKFAVILLLVTLAAITILVAVPLSIILSREYVAGIILLIIATILLFLFIIVVTYINTYGIRYLVLQNSTAKESIKKGYSAFTKNVGNSLKLSFGNCLVQSIIGGIILVGLITLVGIFVGIAIANEGFVRYAVGALIVPAAFAGLLLFSALTGYMTTYKETTWTILFNYINGEGIPTEPAPKVEEITGEQTNGI